MSAGAGRPAAFLDRDGTIVEDVGYLSALEQMVLLPGAGAAIARLNAASVPVVVVSNQSGVARGYFNEDFARASGPHLQGLLAPFGAHLDGYYFCPTLPEGRPPYNVDSPDRKPGPGMLLRARRELGVCLLGAWMVGDKCSDLETGRGLGVVPVLVRTGYGAETARHLPADFAARGGRICADLAQAAEWIVSVA
ncbi:MAG: HAD-IIIA family hydrolase [Candidatus Lambdaproteobacteria bacterium]|nr:HAD-IIIA family hydrolase [Candidatus Lambdaproteobacteria bacterium]